jgi:hypothetical protein
MKSYTINSLNRIGLLFMFLLTGTLYSCQEDDAAAPVEATAPPVVEAVRTTNPAKADSTFTQSTLGSTIVIKGQHLAATQYVSFNGYKTAVNPVYASDNYLIVRIPELTPTGATAANVPDELKVVNAKGETTFKFKVFTPPAIIDAMSNESVKAGETLTLYGKYFYFVKAVTFPGGVKGTNVTAAADGLSLNVTVPAGFDPAKGDVIVTSESGKSAVSARTKLYSVGMVGNFDDKNPFDWGIPASNITTTARGITPLDGRFGLIDMALPGAGGWSNDKVIHLEDKGGAQIYPAAPASHYVAEDPIANYEARMEVAVNNIASLEGIKLEVLGSDKNNKELSFRVELKNFVRSTDGRWYTVFVPLASLVNGSDRFAKYKDLLDGNTAGHKVLRVSVYNTNAADVPATIAVDNIRVVNIAK